MKISGFTFAKNADKLHFPIQESILSILPIVDEFIIALGDCDKDDQTRELIEDIDTDKIRIVDTVWDREKFPKNTVYAQQTDLAKAQSSGDWLFYIQSDEVVHEKYLSSIKEACKKHLEDREVEGMLLQFRHFWGDFDHFFEAHSWYPREIRIIRNLDNIHSWRDAQSFRKFEEWEGTYQDYLKKDSSSKLKVLNLKSAFIHHYGWVRSPKAMLSKAKVGNPEVNDQATAGGHSQPDYFDYGPLNRLSLYKESHPAVMQDKINAFDWEDLLQYSGKPKRNRKLYKHERLKYRLLSYIEQNFLNGRRIGGFKNYKIIR